MNGALSVVAIDISDDAMAEAKRLYRRDNLRFIKGDVERLAEIADLGGPFDVGVNFENIEHLANPTRFLAGVKELLTSEGTFVVSTPNGESHRAGRDWKHQEPIPLEGVHHGRVPGDAGTILWLDGVFRSVENVRNACAQDFEKRLFANLCETYYSPTARMWRGLRRVLGKTNAPPPEYTGEWTCFSRDFTIKPIGFQPFPGLPM